MALNENNDKKKPLRIADQFDAILEHVNHFYLRMPALFQSIMSKSFRGFLLSWNASCSSLLLFTRHCVWIASESQPPA